MENKNKLSIIIPVFNEEKTVGLLLDKVRDSRLSISKEIIVVNDGSTDDSAKKIEEWCIENKNGKVENLEVQYLEKENGGKGSAVREGIKISTGDIVIIQDADLEYDPNDYQACIDPILSGESKVVYGSRELKSNAQRVYSSPSFFLGGLLVTNWMNLLYGSNLTDEPTCYKCFDGQLIRNIRIEGDKFEWEPEITAKILRLKIQIAEVPVAYYPRKLNEGKKIKWSDGVIALWIALVWRFAPMGKIKSELNRIDSLALHIRKTRLTFLALCAILFTAFIIRVLIAIPGFSSPETTFTRPDSASYIMPAKSILHDGKYNTSPASGIPATLRPPGYSLFLAGCLGIFNNNLNSIVIISILLSSLTCIPIYMTCRLFSHSKWILCAPLLFTFNITSIANAPLLLSDTLFGLIIALQLYLFTRFYFLKRSLDVFLAIFLTAVSVYIKPITIPWIVPCLFLVLILPKRKFITKIMFATVCALIFTLTITPWMIRNQNVGTGFRIDSNIGDTALHNASTVISCATGKSAEELRIEMRKDSEKQFKLHPDKYYNENEKIKFKIKYMTDSIKEYPFLYARLHFRPSILFPDVPSLFENLGLTQTGKGTFDVMNRKGYLAGVQHYFKGKMWLLIVVSPLVCITLLLYLGVFIQICIFLYQKKIWLFFLFLAFVEYFLMLPGPVTMPRYQIPALPFMCVMCTITIIHFINLKKNIEWQNHKRI